LEACDSNSRSWMSSYQHRCADFIKIPRKKKEKKGDNIFQRIGPLSL
jgi:hypothetical protein